MTTNHYEQSWELYKAESENFSDDFQYYRNLCQNKKTLELFSGYGRLTNHLKKYTKDIECVELEQNFAKFTNIPKEKIHIENVLKFNPKNTFERIIAGYNSFCLITKDQEIRTFFSLLEKWLTTDGVISLSYYDHQRWEDCPSHEFMHNNHKVYYSSSYKNSKKDASLASWVDIYDSPTSNMHLKFEYPLKKHTKNSIQNYIAHTDLKLTNTIIDYNQNDLDDSGWIEYVFEKNC